MHTSSAQERERERTRGWRGKIIAGRVAGDQPKI